MPVSGLAWEGPLSPSVVTGQLRTDLFGACARRASNEALQAESIRVAVWTLSALKSGAPLTDAAVSTRQILAQARALWQPFQIASKAQAQSRIDQNHESVSETELARDLLATLEDQGDLFSFPGGYWVPAPLRLVPITETAYLLIGGIPTHLLPAAVLEAMHLHGSFRQVDSSAFSGTMPTSQFIGEWKFQELRNLLGLTPPTLEQLIQKFRAIEMQPVSREAISSTFEAYVAYLNKPQFQRWSSLEWVRDGHYLLRTQNAWGLRQHSIGDIQDRRLVRQSTELRSIDIRRLCYALDYVTGTPTTVIWERGQGRLVLRSELPSRERKLLASIGSLRVPKEGYYPREWIGIAAQHAKKVDEMLEQLHVRVSTGYGQ